MQTLTNGQKQALLEAQNGHNIFISGGGGVGKSYISQIIVDELQATGKTVLITASTGKAAMLTKAEPNEQSCFIGKAV